MKQGLAMFALTLVVLGPVGWFLISRTGGHPATAMTGSALTPTSAPAASATSAAVSNDCKLAVLDWRDAADNQYSDVVFDARDHPSNADLTSAANRIETYCASALSDRVRQVDYQLALASAQIGTDLAAKRSRQNRLRDSIGAIADSVR